MQTDGAGAMFPSATVGLMEIRTYELEASLAEQFEAILLGECVPLLEDHGVRVIFGGLSEVPVDGRRDGYLICWYSSEGERQAAETALLGDAAWVGDVGPRLTWTVTSGHTAILGLSVSGPGRRAAS